MNMQSQGFPSVTEKWTFQDHLATKIIVSTQSSSPRDLTKVHSQDFPSATEDWPFQDHLTTETTALTRCSVSQENCSKLCLQGELNNERAKLRLLLSVSNE